MTQLIRDENGDLQGIDYRGGKTTPSRLEKIKKLWGANPDVLWLIEKLEACLPFINLVGDDDPSFCECLEQKYKAPCVHNKAKEILKSIRKENA